MAKFGIPNQQLQLTGETHIQRGVVQDFWRELGDMGRWFKQGYTQYKQQQLADALNEVGAEYGGVGPDGKPMAGNQNNAGGGSGGPSRVGGGSGGGGGAAAAGTQIVMPDGSVQIVGLDGNISHYGPYVGPNGERLWNDPNRGANDKPLEGLPPPTTTRMYLTDIWDEDSPEFKEQQRGFREMAALREATGIAERRGYGKDMVVVPFAGE